MHTTANRSSVVHSTFSIERTYPSPPARVFQQRFFRENLKLGEGGETGQDNRILEQTFQRTATSIMGKRMFEGENDSGRRKSPFIRRSSS